MTESRLDGVLANAQRPVEASNGNRWQDHRG